MATSDARSGRRTLALGVDYGTSSVRALVVDTATGEEIATATWTYSHGTDGVIVDARDPNLARQHPADYVEAFEKSVRAAVQAASQVPGCSADAIVGIGVDTTGSTPLPVDRSGTPLGLLPEYQETPDAMAWLWKDHTSWSEAAEITRRAAERGEPYLAKCGGAYSSEWYWSKILHCSRINPKVAGAAASWVELCDWVPGWLTGNTDPASMARSICAAGHKAMYNLQWGGLPSEAFLQELGLPTSYRRLYTKAVPSDRRAGSLREEIARRVGLTPGIPVAVGAFDAHMGAVGSGIRPGTLVKIMGTSTCDCMVWPMDQRLEDIPGVCGIVPESIMPGMYGIEAGQSAVGDIFNWFAARFATVGPSGGAAEDAHRRLTEEASRLKPGESGLVALDWNNGNRTVLVDPRLTGLLIGQTLATSAAEVYLALIEATAFGALKIIERIEQYGVKVAEIVNCGGIAEKSPLVMQVYADVTGRPMKVSRSSQTCALGAAIFGAVVGGAHTSVSAAQAAMTGVKSTVYTPRPDAVATYRRLFALYSRLHDAFGVRGCTGSLDDVMKQLIDLRETVRRGALA